MAVFISYSHTDKNFVDRLAASLVSHRAYVWLDRWELSVGDSIVARVQEAIEGASALIVVLSRASVASEWCKKEVNAGLMRELEEKRVVVLPVLAEECEIPMFLRGKKYADFRTGFEHGLTTTLEAIAKVTSDTQGRVAQPECHTDWALDWSVTDDRFVLRITFIRQEENFPCTVLTEVVLVANEAATKRHNVYVDAGFDWLGRQLMVEAVAELVAKADLRLRLEDATPVKFGGEILDSRTGRGYQVSGASRRLGEDTGKDILVDPNALFRNLLDAERATLRKLTKAEHERLAGLLKDRG